MRKSLPVSHHVKTYIAKRKNPVTTDQVIAQVNSKRDIASPKKVRNTLQRLAGRNEISRMGLKGKQMTWA